MPDGTRRPYPSPIPFGVMKAGAGQRLGRDQGGNWPIHASGANDAHHISAGPRRVDRYPR
jgi:hypothetical protein